MSGIPLSGTMKPKPLATSNHLMTPVNSMRLVAVSSTSSLTVPGRRLVPDIFDSIPSDDMTPHAAALLAPLDERFADVVPYDQIGEIIELGRFAIDDHESRAVPFGHQRKTGRRPHDQRRTNCQKKVAAPGQFLGSLHRVRWHCLPERNSRGFDVAPAGAVGSKLGRFKFFPDPGQL